MSKIISISVALFLVSAFASAQVLHSCHGTVAGTYNFWFYDPETVMADTTVTHNDELHIKQDPVKEREKNPQWARFPIKPVLSFAPPKVNRGVRPLVVFLHGASLCGNNLSKVRRYGTIDALSRGLKLDAFVLAPQNHGGAWNPDKIDKIVRWAIDNYPVDSTRVYVLGMSLGGYGTIDYAAEYPHRVAAAIGMCGGATSKNLCNLNEVPLYIMHGTADQAVPFSASKKVADGMAKCGNTSRLIFYPIHGVGHGELARYFYLPEVYDWLFSHSLTDTNRPVTHSIDLNYANLRNVYRRLQKPKKPFRVEEYRNRSPKEHLDTLSVNKNGKDSAIDEVQPPMQQPTPDQVDPNKVWQPKSQPTSKTSKPVASQSKSAAKH